MFWFLRKSPDNPKTAPSEAVRYQPTIEELECRVVTDEGIIAAHEKVLALLIASADEHTRRTLAAGLKVLVGQGYNEPMPTWIPHRYVHDFRSAACATCMDFIRAAELSSPPQSN
jgi:hypothetical protein